MKGRNWSEGIDFEGMEHAGIGDKICLKGTGLWLEVTDRMQPLCRGGRELQRSVVGRVSQSSHPVLGFDRGSLCVLMTVCNSSDQTVIPLKAMVYREDLPTLKLIK